MERHWRRRPVKTWSKQLERESGIEIYIFYCVAVKTLKTLILAIACKVLKVLQRKIFW